MIALLRRRRGVVLVAAGTAVVVALVAALVVIAGQGATRDPRSGAPAHSSLRISSPNAGITPDGGNGGVLVAPGSPLVSPPPESDVKLFGQIPAVTPATSSIYPPVAATVDADPDEYAAAFTTELLGQNYAGSTRQSLLAWAQSEDALDALPGITSVVAAKELVVSLTNPADSTAEGIVPTESTWTGLAAEQASSVASDVQVTLLPVWEQAIAGGFQPSDPLMTMRQVTATVTMSDTTAGQPQTSTSSIAFDLVLGSATGHSGYGAMAVGDFTVVSG